MSEQPGRHPQEISLPVHLVPPRDLKNPRHYWVAQVLYHLSERALRSELVPMLDRENLVSLSPATCYYCEFVYDELIAARPCDGDPNT